MHLRIFRVSRFVFSPQSFRSYINEIIRYSSECNFSVPYSNLPVFSQTRSSGASLGGSGGAASACLGWTLLTGRLRVGSLWRGRGGKIAAAAAPSEDLRVPTGVGNNEGDGFSSPDLYSFFVVQAKKYKRALFLYICHFKLYYTCDRPGRPQ